MSPPNMSPPNMGPPNMGPPNSPERLDELISRHLDGIAEPAEAEELGRRLATDPRAAERFAEATRFDGLLERVSREGRAIPIVPGGPGLLGPFPPPQLPQARRFPGWVRWSAAAAASLLVGAGLWHWGLHSLTGPGSATAPMPFQVIAGKVVVGGLETDRPGPDAAVQVSDQGPAVIRLSDSAHAELAPESRAVLRGPLGSLTQTVELSEGRGRFRIGRDAADDSETGRLQVRTPIGTVSTRTGEFTVELTERHREGEPQMNRRLKWVTAMAVAVAAGTVQVEIAGRAWTLSAGESRVFAAEGDRPREGDRAPRVVATAVLVTKMPDSELIAGLEKQYGERLGITPLPDMKAVVLRGTESAVAEAVRAMQGILADPRADAPRESEREIAAAPAIEVVRLRRLNPESAAGLLPQLVAGKVEVTAKPAAKAVLIEGDWAAVRQAAILIRELDGQGMNPAVRRALVPNGED